MEKCLILFQFPCLPWFFSWNWKILSLQVIEIPYCCLTKKDDVRFEFVLLNIVWLCLIFLVCAHFWQKVGDVTFKIYWNTLIFSITKLFVVRSKFVPHLFGLIFFIDIIMEILWNLKVFSDFKIRWKTSLKILCLKGYKWLLSKKQEARLELLDCATYWPLTTDHVYKTFF